MRTEHGIRRIGSPSVLSTTRKLLELIRFSHTLFALPFALLAACMAWNGNANDLHDTSPALKPAIQSQESLPRPPIFSNFLEAVRWRELGGILLCMVFARSAAMAFNRLADRRIDAANPRTAARHLPRGDLSVAAVTAFAIACSLAFVASTALFLPNRLPLYLAAPVLLFLLGYSFAKRFTAFSHFWLGAALAASPVAAWIAIRGEVVLVQPFDLLPALVLGGAVLTWVAGFDIIYACQDADFDRRARLHSVPARLGVRTALRLAAACHLVTIGFLTALPFVYPPFGVLHWTGVALVATLLLFEHSLVRPNDLTRVNVAFFNVNAVISFGLFAVGTLDLLLGSRS